MPKTTTSAWKQIKKLKDRELTRTICDAIAHPVRGPSGRKLSKKEMTIVESNPFARIIFEDGYMPSACGHYLDLANIFLWQQQAGNMPGRLIPSPSHGTEYVSIADYIKEQTKWPLLSSLPDGLFFEPDIEQVTGFYFNQNQVCFDYGIESSCRLVYHGMPIYKKSKDDLFTIVPFDDHDYVYLSMKYLYDETRGGAHDLSGRYPNWSELYYFRIAHFRPYLDVFGRSSNTYPEIAVRPMRENFRKSIGIESEQPGTMPVSAPKHFRLVPYVNQVLNKDCPGLFPDDGKTWPKQEAISKWLQTNKNLSERQANAIALVATQSR